jgi:Ca2+-binding RTX toxin-like protein
VIVGGSSAQTSLIQGGAGPVTVFGGFGAGIYSGGPGSAFVIGAGASTVTAAAGDLVWVTGNAPVSVAGSGSGAEVYGGTATGNDIYQAGTGNETLWGGLGNDLFIAGRGGTDIFTSGGGDDVFSFLNGSAGADVDIVGFVTGQDSIALHGYGDQVPAITVAFGDSILHLSDGTQIVVEGVTNLTAASFTLT